MIKYTETNWSVVFVFIGIIVLICLYYILRYMETIWAQYYKRPFFVHFYLFQKKINNDQRAILATFPFYQKLSLKEKGYFEHRAYCFLKEIAIYGRAGQVINDSIRIKIAMKAVMLTFGMRNYLLEYLKTIIVYPTAFYSRINDAHHIGEYNPMVKSLVFSWKDFVSGNATNDGVNLAIHELTHAVHYNAIKNNDISSEIFYDTFLILEQHLNVVELRNRLSDSNLLRAYAFTDKFEFVAVLIEVFIESPKRLKLEFPEIYKLLRQMLNFRFSGY